MNRNTMLKILNPLLILLLVNQMLTGMFGRSMSREAFQLFHKGGGVVLAAALVLHIILNWTWIRATYLKRRQSRGSTAG